MPGIDPTPTLLKKLMDMISSSPPSGDPITQSWLKKLNNPFVNSTPDTLANEPLTPELLFRANLNNAYQTDPYESAVVQGARQRLGINRPYNQDIQLPRQGIGPSSNIIRKRRQ